MPQNEIIIISCVALLSVQGAGPAGGGREWLSHVQSSKWPLTRFTSTSRTRELMLLSERIDASMRSAPILSIGPCPTLSFAISLLRLHAPSPPARRERSHP
jgi:hypothetical protein